jgi:NitT/TauT family transport system substrate-binding protein
MTNLKRVRVFALCIGFILSAAGLKPILARAQSLPKVIIGYPARSIASIQLFIAQEKGFFREEGVDVQLNQVRADAAMAAVLTGELFAYDSVGTSVRAFQNGAPVKILAVNLQSPLFWLVTRPELKSFSDLKGKVMGTTSFGGVQHLAGLRMLRRGGLNPNQDVAVVLAGDTTTQLQSIVNGAIQIAVLMFSPTHWMSSQAFSKAALRLPIRASRIKKIGSSAFFARGPRQTGFSSKLKLPRAKSSPRF